MTLSEKMLLFWLIAHEFYRKYEEEEIPLLKKLDFANFVMACIATAMWAIALILDFIVRVIEVI